MSLDARFGEAFVSRRRALERARSRHLEASGWTGTGFIRRPPIWSALQRTLRLTGLDRAGRRAAAAVEVRTNVVWSPRLPSAFDGYRILQLSDLHADISQAALAVTRRRVRGLDHDLAVLTGDYRDGSGPDFDRALATVGRLVRVLRPPVYAVLGNHDLLDMVPPLEAMGVRCLVNEASSIEQHGERLHVAGIDDAFRFKTHDLEGALAQVPPDGFTVLLSHSPEPWREAARAGVDLMLSGHTHGGQVCLPGGVPLSLMADIPRRLGRGPWREGGLQGYTAAGCGTGGLPIRFFCPPEATLHVLRRSA